MRFDADGTLSARLGASGTERGTWSLDARKRVRADGLSVPLVADAWVRGEELTLVLDGRALVLRRDGEV
ncbi:MAG: hypothetical protein ACLP8S_04510 [Solirubrobacteraceae bacterium]